MSDLRKAAQMALEALEDMDSDDPELNQEWLGKQAITALRAALAQPEKTNQCAETCERAKLCAVCASEIDDVNPEPVAKVELMTTGGNAGLATRIVEIDDHLRERLRPGQLLYVNPPQRKPLTDDEIKVIEDEIWNTAFFDATERQANREFTRAIERAHGIKE